MTHLTEGEGDKEGEVVKQVGEVRMVIE